MLPTGSFWVICQQGALWTQIQFLCGWKGGDWSGLPHLLFTLLRVLTPARLACLVHSMASTSSQLPIPTPCFSPPLHMPIVQMRRLRHTEAKKAGRDSSRAEWRQSWLWSQKTWVASMPVQHLTPCVVGVRFGGFTEQSHCRCNKLNVAAHTTPRLRTILMLGSQPRGDSTGSWEEGLAKGD